MKYFASLGRKKARNAKNEWPGDHQDTPSQSIGKAAPKVGQSHMDGGGHRPDETELNRVSS
jgi:hypothetical protein